MIKLKVQRTFQLFLAVSLFMILLGGCNSTPAEVNETLDPKDFASNYKSIDAEIEGSQIAFLENGIYQRYYYNGSEFTEFTGIFTVTKTTERIIIALQPMKSEGGLPGDELVEFEYINDRLILISGGLQEGFYDHTKAKTFAKFTGELKDPRVTDNKGETKPDDKRQVTKTRYYAFVTDLNKKDKNVYIELRSDGSYVQKYNMCAGYITIKGTYKKDGPQIILKRKSGDSIYKEAYFVDHGDSIEIAGYIATDGAYCDAEDGDFWFDCSYAFFWKK